ncbi:MAG TPA: tetratricopeptide repeat protein, partial [archaeon]|nr:tetratricopeptide repeat protein [archaeon]
KGYFSLGQILYRRGLYSESISVLKRADELEANNPEALFLLGEAYNKIDEIDMAVSCFETVLKYQQDNPKVYYNLGILYDKKGMPEKASLMYRQAKELSSPQFVSSQKISLMETKEEGTFFSRSLTVVNPHFKQSDGKTVNKERYEKFRVKQLKKKPYRVQNFQESLSENVGTMDLTKASLKINEAIKIIKEKRK